MLKIQHLLHICSEHIEAKEKDEKEKDKKEGDKKDADKKTEDTVEHLAAHQAAAVLGIALISMGEEIGSEMSLRSFGHLVSLVRPVLLGQIASLTHKVYMQVYTYA